MPEPLSVEEARIRLAGIYVKGTPRRYSADFAKAVDAFEEAVRADERASRWLPAKEELKAC